MDKSFWAYVFRPHHVVLAVIALRGILSGKHTGAFWALFIGEVIHFIVRGVGYFAQQRVWMNRLEQRQQQEKESKMNQNTNGPQS